MIEQKIDDQVAVSMVSVAKKRFPALNACGLDKGFRSPGNQIALKKSLEQVALP